VFSSSGFEPDEMPIIAPSILSADFGRLAEEVRAVTAAGADWIHVDVMDGHFVPPITIGPLVVEAIRRATPLPLDVHLMVELPQRLIGEFARVGANRVTVHVEACRDVVAVLRAARQAGVAPGLALNPETPLDDVEPYLGQIDLLLVMGVHPGWGGQRSTAASSRRTAPRRLPRAPTCSLRARRSSSRTTTPPPSGPCVPAARKSRRHVKGLAAARFPLTVAAPLR
jgi:ribulose-phosphate 3-epimerase